MSRNARVLYVARHGETDWNVEGRWQGHTDIPLNDRGRRQARALAETLRAHGLRAAASSDLARARETARIVADVLRIPHAHEDARLRERSFGLFEGLTRSECVERHPAAWESWTRDRTPPTGAETHAALAARLVAGAEHVAVEVAAAGPALLVTHGGALRALVEAITGTLPPFVDNGEVWRLTHDGRFVDAAKV